MTSARSCMTVDGSCTTAARSCTTVDGTYTSPLARIDPPLLTRTDPPRCDHAPLPATRPAPHSGGAELPVVDMCDEKEDDLRAREVRPAATLKHPTTRRSSDAAPGGGGGARQFWNG